MNRQCILIVEDEQAHAELICRAFEECEVAEYEVLVARSVHEAQNYLDASVPDLVIADLLLPDGKGTELIGDWKTGDRIPLIVMTSHGNEQAAVDALKGGALDYVVKSPAAFLDMPRFADRAIREWGHIVDRRRMEKALKESEERFRTVFESAEECIFIKNPSLRYTHVNRAMSRLLGLDPAEIIGRRAEDLYGEETGRQLTERETRVLAGESIEAEQTRPVQGTSMTFHDTVVPLRNETGNITGICCISRNITERKKLGEVTFGTGRTYTSQAMRDTFHKAGIASQTDSIILLQGESGTGKDYLARWLHDHSKRAGGPFFSINCSALPRELAESEFFGHERGAFTGAVSLKKGMLELAEGGTILLNEIGELELPLQAKLLTFLDTQSFVRVGGQKHIRVNARLIAASHRDLDAEVDHGRFLEALYYRLSVFPIRLPPLRERKEDIPILVEEIMQTLVIEMQLTDIPVLESRHITALSRYHWPGNVRELRNVLERSLILWDGGRFNFVVPGGAAAEDDWSYTVRYVPGKTIRECTTEVENFLCSAALHACGGNKKEAARLLSISRDAFYRYLKRVSKGATNETI
ncbi:MAG: sigma 54-interacting transcriptional regulator [Desulfomonilaceae bacterium]|nr:sigma 54-interacting transcriptional regulator [Desulfomonilaceae bacterium]